jgi:small subunit ribosomal protein S4
MARDRGPICKICRREGVSLHDGKCAFHRRSYAPGMHGQRVRKLSEYGIQLREKQKVRRMYGLLERQFRRYFERADRYPGVTGERLLQLLETRLDNVVYLLGFSRSRRGARQLVSHGHFMVNGQRVTIPSYQLTVGDEIVLRPKSTQATYFQGWERSQVEHQLPDWLELDEAGRRGKVLAIPGREQLPAEINEQLIVEYYSR